MIEINVMYVVVEQCAHNVYSSDVLMLSHSKKSRRLERTEDDAPKKMPAVEREERRRSLASRLGGLLLNGSLDPSHSLIDACGQMHEESSVIYISWEQRRTLSNK